MQTPGSHLPPALGLPTSLMEQVLRGPGGNACQAAPLLLPGPGWQGTGVRGRRHTPATGAGEGSGRRRCRRRKTGKHAQDTGMEAQLEASPYLAGEQGTQGPCPQRHSEGSPGQDGDTVTPNSHVACSRAHPKLKDSAHRSCKSILCFYFSWNDFESVYLYPPEFK